MHARPIGVEDPGDLDRQLVLTVVVEEQRLGAALALIVAGARSDRVDVTPVVLGLWMNRRVAVHFGGRGLQDSRLHAFGQAEHVDGAVDAGLGGLHRVELVMDRRGRAGEVVDLVHLHIKREAHIVAHQLEAGISDKAVHIVARAGIEIVDAQDLVTAL